MELKEMQEYASTKFKYLYFIQDGDGSNGFNFPFLFKENAMKTLKELKQELPFKNFELVKNKYDWVMKLFNNIRCYDIWDLTLSSEEN